MLLDLSEVVEASGFDSVWVGDSLFSKPRYEPITLLAAISQRTSRVKLGTACMVTSTRNPLYLALEWATLDQLSGGRTILGTGAWATRRRASAASSRRSVSTTGDAARMFEEGLAVMRELWTTGSVTFHGRYFDYDDIGFFSGTEMGPLMPQQTAAADLGRLEPAPEGRRAAGRDGAPARGGLPADPLLRRRLDDVLPRAASRRSSSSSSAGSSRSPTRLETDFDRLTISYQVTMNIGDSEDEARTAFGDYISKYYPELSQAMDLSNWGPVGTPTDRRAGSGRSPTQASTTSSAASAPSTSSARSERFAREVLPLFTRRARRSE